MQAPSRLLLDGVHNPIRLSNSPVQRRRSWNRELHSTANAGAQRSGRHSTSKARSFAITQAARRFTSPVHLIDVSPASGTGAAATFTARYGTARPAGAPIERAYFSSTRHECGEFLLHRIHAATNTFRLIQDDGINWNARYTRQRRRPQQ